MESAVSKAAQLKQQIEKAENKLQALKSELAQIESVAGGVNGAELSDHGRHGNGGIKWPLSLQEYSRYGRQMIVPAIGIQGQLRVKDASVLIIGAGGLGCPAASYLAGAGVKRLGVVDGDTVELSNLHRQTLHRVSTVGHFKVDSVITSLVELNPNVQYTPYREHLSPENALGIVTDYDVVLDCTDRPSSRYLISDVSVILEKPLISASALRTDGQLVVLNYPPKPAGDNEGGPCYRCIFPKPPPPDQVISCGDGGILGPVVGVMGVLQALEALKLIVAGVKSSASRLPADPPPSPSLLLFSAMSTTPFRTVRLRPRRRDCAVCSAAATITSASLMANPDAYITFCGLTASANVLPPSDRIAATELAVLLESQQDMTTSPVLIDVREKVQFDICNLQGSINVPFSKLQGQRALDHESCDWLPSQPDRQIFVVCRLGNDSQIVVRRLKEGIGEARQIDVRDVRGGLKAWKQEVDHEWPEY